MMFWDSSAVGGLLFFESRSVDIERVFRLDGTMVLWWGTRTECAAAIQRSRREKRISDDAVEGTVGRMLQLNLAATRVHPDDKILDRADRLLTRHPLSAADALQLSAALAWAGDAPGGKGFVCLDSRLRDAARKEGFTLHPA